MDNNMLHLNKMNYECLNGFISTCRENLEDLLPEEVSVWVDEKCIDVPVPDGVRASYMEQVDELAPFTREELDTGISLAKAFPVQPNEQLVLQNSRSLSSACMKIYGTIITRAYEDAKKKHLDGGRALEYFENHPDVLERAMQELQKEPEADDRDYWDYFSFAC